MPTLRTYLLEDNAAELANVRDFLAQRCPGVEVVGASGEVQEGFEGIVGTRPDLLISDIQLIGGNCYDLLERLDAAGRLAGLRIVFMTFFQDFDKVRDEFAHAPVDFLEKPFTPQNLQRAVEKVTQIPITSQTHRQVVQLLKLLTAARDLPPLPPENPPSAGSLRRFLRRLFGRNA